MTPRLPPESRRSYQAPEIESTEAAPEPEPLTGRDWDIWCAGFVQQRGASYFGGTVEDRAGYADRCLRKYREHVASEGLSFLKDSNMDVQP